MADQPQATASHVVTSSDAPTAAWRHLRPGFSTVLLLCAFSLWQSYEEGAAVKMVILVREDVPLGFAMVAVAHASLAGYLKFQDTSEVEAWLNGPFYKVVCKVNEKEFRKAKGFADHVVITESALADAEVALVFKPRDEWPKPFRFYRLYR